MVATRILVYSPGKPTTDAVDLMEGEEALVGRSPDWTKVGSGGSGQTLTVSAPSVSANHLQIRHEGSRVRFLDLNSRNGTWVAVPTQGELATARLPEQLAVHLAPAAGTGAQPLPANADWGSEKAFATVLANSIEAWLDANNLPVTAEVVPGQKERDENLCRIPLATGQDLLIEPKRTVGTEWFVALTTIERWVRHQNVLFETEQSMRDEGLVVCSRAMRYAVAAVVNAARNGSGSLLLAGPSGSGKEGLARCFHRNTGRPGPFIPRNCAMFTPDFVRTELFGAEKGAFTGSVRRIVGAVEAADEGTLFLDELGELSPDVQAMLLRFLDRGEYERLGAYGQMKRANVRIVAATNRDLREAALTQQFRADLWFRLTVNVVAVPSLKERPEDIEAFLAARDAGGKDLLSAISPETLKLLKTYDWPGNFRELANFAERATSFARSGILQLDVASRLLGEGALRPPERVAEVPAPTIAADIQDDTVASLMNQARVAFLEDHGEVTTFNWDHIKELIESYLKPLLFASLSGNINLKNLDGVDFREASKHLGADRGTAVKQLRRFVDRFTQPTSGQRNVG